MWKKVLVASLLLCLTLSQVAFAAQEETTVVTPEHGLRYQAKVFFERVRLGLTFNPARKARLLADQARERLRELEALQETDPEAVTEKLLAAHDKAVERAQQIVASGANLPQEIIDRLADNQLKALDLATQAVEKAKDPVIAEKRINLLKARQEMTMAMVSKHAERIAERTLQRAEQIIANSDEVRARIEAGEGLDMLRARMQKWKDQVQQQRREGLQEHRGR